MNRVYPPPQNTSQLIGKCFYRGLRMGASRSHVFPRPVVGAVVVGRDWQMQTADIPVRETVNRAAPDGLHSAEN